LVYMLPYSVLSRRGDELGAVIMPAPLVRRDVTTMLYFLQGCRHPAWVYIICIEEHRLTYFLFRSPTFKYVSADILFVPRKSGLPLRFSQLDTARKKVPLTPFLAKSPKRRKFRFASFFGDTCPVFALLAGVLAWWSHFPFLFPFSLAGEMGFPAV